MNTDNVSNIKIFESIAATAPPSPPHKEEPCHLRKPTRKNFPSMLPARNPSGVAGISPRTNMLNRSKTDFSAIHPAVFPIIYFNTKPRGLIF